MTSILTKVLVAIVLKESGRPTEREDKGKMEVRQTDLFTVNLAHTKIRKEKH